MNHRKHLKNVGELMALFCLLFGHHRMHFLTEPQESSTSVYDQPDCHTLRPYRKTGAADPLEIIWPQTQLFYSQWCYLIWLRLLYSAVSLQKLWQARGHSEWVNDVLQKCGCSVDIFAHELLSVCSGRSLPFSSSFPLGCHHARFPCWHALCLTQIQ